MEETVSLEKQPVSDALGEVEEDIIEPAEGVPVISADDLKDDTFPSGTLRMYYQCTVVCDGETVVDISNLVNLFGATHPDMLNFTGRQLQSILDMQISEPAKIQINAFLRRAKAAHVKTHSSGESALPQLPTSPPIPSPDVMEDMDEEEDEDLSKPPLAPEVEDEESDVVDALPPPIQS